MDILGLGRLNTPVYIDDPRAAVRLCVAVFYSMLEVIVAQFIKSFVVVEAVSYFSRHTDYISQLNKTYMIIQLLAVRENMAYLVSNKCII